MDKVDTLDKVYPLKKAGDLLGYAVSTIRKKIRAGQIQAIQYSPGGKLMIAESEIRRIRDATSPVYVKADFQPNPAPDTKIAAAPEAAAQDKKTNDSESCGIGAF
jgi:hypothetical protein